MMMNEEGSSSILHQQSSSRRKREPQQFSHTKKLRSRIPRRKRRQISPIPTGSLNYQLSDDKVLVEFPALPAGSSSSSCFPDEISCASNWFSVGSKSLSTKKSRSSLKKENAKTRRSSGVNADDARNSSPSVRSPRDEYRRMTRLYLKQKENERATVKKENGDLGAELSESSCVDSFSRVEAGIFCKSNDVLSIRNLTGRQYRKVVEQLEECERTAASAGASVSEVSYIQQENSTGVNVCESGKTEGKTSKLGTEDVTELQRYEITDTSLVESLPEEIFQNICQPIGEISEKTNTVTESGSSMSETSRINYAEPGMIVKNSEPIADQKPEDFNLDYSLACSECLSYEEDSEKSRGHEMKLSEFESDIFPDSFDMESSDFSALLTDSPSDFSEKYAEKSTPPVYFPLFLQYTTQFCRLSSPRDDGAPAQDHDKYFDEFTSLRFEDEEHEESYKNFRSRERKVIVHDYAEVYRSTTEFGDLILQQRLLMVNWIVAQSKSRELHGETIFLAVSLFDRFLNQGFFKNKRKLQVLGVACLTLATRIEENQPLNCVRQQAFHVGSNAYSRSEVIAMEWLVQKVLDFQFFLPTTYNFLWFYLKAARADVEVEKRTKYLAFMSLLDHERLCYWPSTVAAGLVILASLAADQDSSCQRVMETHVRTKNDDLSECIKSLEWLVKYVC